MYMKNQLKQNRSLKSDRGIFFVDFNSFSNPFEIRFGFPIKSKPSPDVGEKCSVAILIWSSTHLKFVWDLQLNQPQVQK